MFSSLLPFGKKGSSLPGENAISKRLVFTLLILTGKILPSMSYPMFDIKDLFIEHKHLGFVTTFANLPYYFLYMNLPVMVEDIYYLIPPH